jgi:hypothetical protein
MFDGIIFDQSKNEQPAGANEAAHELFNGRSLRSFLKKKQRAARWRERSITGALLNARSLREQFITKAIKSRTRRPACGKSVSLLTLLHSI